MVRSSYDSIGKRAFIIGLIIFVALLGWLLFSPRGALKYYHLQRAIKEIRSRNDVLEIQNKDLQKEINKLKNDNSYLEEIARREYGLIKKNEMVFQFEEKKKH